MSNTHQTGTLASQSQLQGRYSIIETVGEGGMGSVYKAIDTQANNRVVAVKEMSQNHLQNPAKLHEAQELFRREAEILSSLSHPNLPHVYASFNENGRSYLVMDFIEGQTLEQLLTASAMHRLPVKDVLDYALQLCAVLSYLHQQIPPIIFRDLKPSNVMVSGKGSVYLIDFGIARVFKQGLLRDTQNLGTPGFASPEQHGSGQTEPRSDLYSLGATLHYCLTGKDPQSNTPTLFHFLPAHDDNSQVPLRLSELLQCLVATKQDQRPLNAQAVSHELRSIQRQARHSTSSITSGYDVKTASTAQCSSWMLRHTKLPRRLGVWWTSTGIPWVAKGYGILCAWFLLTMLPQLKQFYCQIAVSPTSFWQSFFSKQARLLGRAVWTPYFIFLFLMLAVAMIGSSLYMLTPLHYSVNLIALYLCLLLLILLGAAIGNQRIRHPLAQSILLGTVLCVVLVAITLFATPEVLPIMEATTFNQLLSLCMGMLLTVSMLRPKERFGWVDHVCLASVSATYALLLSGVGTQVLQQLLASTLQLLPIAISNMVSLNAILICILCAIALIQLARCKYPFIGSDRVQLFIVALTAAPLQFFYGIREIPHIPFFSLLASEKTMATPSDLASLTILLMGIPILVAVLWLFIAPGFSRLGRLPLLPLALACVALQSFLGLAGQFPLQTSPLFLLTHSLGSIMHLNQLTAYGLALISGVLFCRWQHPFKRFEQFSLFYVAIVCALLQNAAWNTDTLFASPPVHSLMPPQTTIAQSQLYIGVINKLLTQAFILSVLMALTIAIMSIFMHFAYQFAWAIQQIHKVKRRFAWLDQLGLRLNHLLLLITTLSSLFLLWLFGSSIPLLMSTVFTTTFKQQKYNVTLSQLLILFLILCSIIALTRLSSLFSRIDRGIILGDAIVCTLLLWSSEAQQADMQHQLEIIKIKPWLADPHIVLPSQGIALGLLLAVLVSFMWIRRRFPEPYGSLLKIGFGLALACTVLQWLAPFFLLAALILVILSMLLVMQVEQMQ